MKFNKRKHWRVPALLLLLGSLNILFGALQIESMWQEPPEIPDEYVTYFEQPIPIVVHIVFGIIFNLVGPFQFAPGLLKRRPAWHRMAGRLLIISGLFVGFTGLWMNHFYPAYGAPFKYWGVLAHSTILIVGLIIAFWAVKQRDFQTHRAWMMRAVAAGLGPATQRLFILPYFLAFGIPNDFVIGLIVCFGILANMAVVETILWKEGNQKKVQELAKIKVTSS